MASRPHCRIHRTSSLPTAFASLLTVYQLLSVISLLSSDTPNLDSPANVDAAKEVRTDLAGGWT